VALLLLASGCGYLKSGRWEDDPELSYFEATIESTWIVLVGTVNMPVMLTFLPANFSGVF
jgi:hypothetical protein